jgi:hypothetical protein
MQVLEERTDVGGREYLDRVLEGLLAALEAPRPAERNMALLAGMHAALDRRDILLSFHHHGLKAMAAANAWDGALHQGPVDYLMVVDSNVGFSKVNRNIESEITYQVDLSRMDAPHARLDITYRNRSPGKQPPTCQVQSADASGQTYEELKSACYWDYLRVYTPKGARLEAASPMPMPDGALYRRIGYDDREETLRTYQEGDKEVVAGFFTVEIGETRTLALAYVLPSYVVSNGPTGATYTLYVQRQPGASAVPVQLVLRLPSGFRAMSHDLDWETVGGMATAATVLTKDLKVITHLVPADA